jgi:hypothetical protein
LCRRPDTAFGEVVEIGGEARLGDGAVVIRGLESLEHAVIPHPGQGGCVVEQGLEGTGRGGVSGHRVSYVPVDRGCRFR